MILKAKNIHKTYFSSEKTEVLKGIDLKIQKGRSLAIMGASGEGKTTLLHILGTLEKADQGSIELMGKQIEDHSCDLLRNQHIGFIFQSFHLLEDFSALENVLMPARIARQSLHKDSGFYKRAKELLEKVGLKDRKHHPAKVLSGGEKQRVAIARALCNNPDLILADEPSGNLDYYGSQQIHTLLLDCVKEMQKSLIIATHDENLAKLCDEVFLLQDGLLTQKKK